MADPFESVPATQPTSWPEGILCLCGDPDNCSCPPTPASDLRERIAESLLDPLKCCVVVPFPLTPIHGTCKNCWADALAVADLVLAALAGDPGNLPARMADAMRDPGCECLTHDGPCIEHLVAAALSVRWEHAAHLAARVGDAERRAEHAESEHQVTQERLAEARDERDAARLVSKGRTMEHYDAEAAIERARKLHQRDDSNPRGPWCPTCTTLWPCLTATALWMETNE